ncbi:S8 family peptidase [Bacteroides finegoldii]|uniref:S8 family peptidase n=1 Tax=Bacteroides finegoldii TaxID=338188 RepID=UPI00267414BC|nr:subtilase family N-terminal domain-containing protein [Bacteroides finegoldii]
MKKIYYKIAILFTAFFVSCTDTEMVTTNELTTPVTSIPADACRGELLIKFKPEVADLLDQAQTRSERGVMTRSSIPTVDEVLDVAGAYHFERIFPVDVRHEERTRKRGLHLWYLVRFDKDADLQKIAQDLSNVGEIAAIEYNRTIKRAYNTQKRPFMLDEQTKRAIAMCTSQSAERPFNDPGLALQWSYINNGTIKEAKEGTVTVDADVNCKEAWKKCTGDPSIIVAVLDEGVMYTHKDLAQNMWKNPGENDVTSPVDNDGNGYAGDVHGYNFVSGNGYISWSEATDTGHGTHVAGTIAAVNNNGIGVSGIAGGDGTDNSGVKIMSCQLFSGDKGVTLFAEAQAIKYAADNGAVILQCSWGYNSGRSNAMNYTPGPTTDEEWASTTPLEKEALDYFVNNAGSPNGVIEGGIVVFAAGNEFAPMSSYPGAYKDYISVAATAADETPACYSNYSTGVDISAPGGDSWYHCTEYGSILSTLPGRGTATPDENGSTSTDFGDNYGYYEGTSMACPHVSGVAALGLSYAVKLGKHFRAEDFRKLLLKSTQPITYSDESKLYYENWSVNGTNHPTRLQLSDYVGQVGGMIDAALLLNNIEGSGVDMKVPNIYLGTGKTTTINLATYFKPGNADFTCQVADETVATVTEIAPGKYTVKGLKSGLTKAVATAKLNGGSATTQEFYITVRTNAGGNGWL